jgi:ribosome-associated protein
VRVPADRDDLQPGRIRLAPRVSVAGSSLYWSQSRSGGPGGQNVNKTASKAELRVAPADIEGLGEAAQRRLHELGAPRLDAEGRLLFTCEETRSLRQNRELALERLRELVLAALAVPRPRRPTRPSRASRQRRLDAKQHLSTRKQQRRDRGD